MGDYANDAIERDLDDFFSEDDNDNNDGYDCGYEE